MLGDRERGWRKDLGGRANNDQTAKATENVLCWRCYGGKQEVNFNEGHSGMEGWRAFF
jgi:hypothetical protein